MEISWLSDQLSSTLDEWDKAVREGKFELAFALDKYACSIRVQIDNQMAQCMRDHLCAWAI